MHHLKGIDVKMPDELSCNIQICRPALQWQAQQGLTLQQAIPQLHGLSSLGVLIPAWNGVRCLVQRSDEVPDLHAKQRSLYGKEPGLARQVSSCRRFPPA